MPVEGIKELWRQVDRRATVPETGLTTQGPQHAGPGAAGEQSGVGAADVPAEAAPLEQHAAAGVRWTMRAGFAALFEGAPGSLWSDPGSHGWQPVKHSATRAVWRGQLAGVSCYLKYYHPAGWTDVLKLRLGRSACAAEWNAALYALRAGVSAVRPIGWSQRVSYRGRPACLLVTEAVEPAYCLTRFWHMVCTDDDPRRRRQDTTTLIELLAEMIARAHQAGFEHRDMHAANILVQSVAPGRYRTVLVDLHNARIGAPLEARAVVRSLCQLNQWFRRHSGVKDRLRFLRRYLRWRNEYEPLFEHGRPLDVPFAELVRLLDRQAERHAWRLWAKRDRRCLREGRYFARLRVGRWRANVFLRSKRAVRHSPASGLVLSRSWWRRQLADPQRWLDEPGGSICKRSHSALVARIALPIDGKSLAAIVKRPVARNWRRGLRLLLAPSRSRRGWRLGHALLNRDIPTARPLALLERRLGPLVFDSFLLTEEIPGAVDLESWLRREFERCSPGEWHRLKRALHARLVRHLRLLAQRGFVHRDCKAQNVLVTSDLHLFWVDLDGIRRRQRVRLADELDALVRLHVSLRDVPGLTRGDRARFLRDYLARFGRDPAEMWRRLWPSLVRAGERKLRAKQLRAAWKRKHYGRP